MANSFTDLMPQMYEALNEVAREQIGLIPAVMRSVTSQQVSKDDSVKIPIVGSMASQNVVASNVAPTGSDMNVNHVDLTITKSKKVSFHTTGEESMGLKENEADIFQQSLAQGMRQLASEIETDLSALFVHACRSTGAIGTVPFGTADDLRDLSRLRQILDTNGTPMAMRSAVLNSDVLVNLRGKQPSVFRVNEAGEPVGRRQGAVGTLFGFDIGESSYFQEHSQANDIAGTLQINKNGGHSKGDTVLTVDGTAAGDSIKAGDIITIAGDDNQYIVAENATGAFTTLTINAPGLMENTPDDSAITPKADTYLPSFGLQKSAILLGVRPPASPQGGDMATDRTMLMDEKSTLVFEISEYKQYRQVSYEVAAAWGVVCLRPEYLALLVS